MDDGSTDNTSAIINHIAAHDPRIIHVGSHHSGVAHAFNFGLSKASGKYIARMDSDDIMHSEKIAEQAKFLDEHPEVGVVSCLVQHGGSRETQEGYARHVDWINTLITPEQIELNRFIDSPVCNPSVMFRRELVEKHGGAIHGDFPEDYEMWLRWMDAGVRFAKIPELLFQWNDLPSRLTRNDSRYSPEAFERAKISYLTRFIRENNPEDRPLFLCGGGRITRKKSELLVKSGLKIAGYVDISSTRIGNNYNGIPIVCIEQLPPPTGCYLVNYVSVRGAREELRNLFLSQNRKEGKDFISAA